MWTGAPRTDSAWPRSQRPLAPMRHRSCGAGSPRTRAVPACIPRNSRENRGTTSVPSTTTLTCGLSPADARTLARPPPPNDPGSRPPHQGAHATAAPARFRLASDMRAASCSAERRSESQLLSPKGGRNRTAAPRDQWKSSGPRGVAGGPQPEHESAGGVVQVGVPGRIWKESDRGRESGVCADAPPRRLAASRMAGNAATLNDGVDRSLSRIRGAVVQSSPHRSRRCSASETPSLLGPRPDGSETLTWIVSFDSSSIVPATM